MQNQTMVKNMAKGFTLIEVLVSVSIFAMVMLVATGAVFSIVEANKKSHSLKSVMTNLNFALESMARDIRVGEEYSCTGGGASGGDCPSTPGTIFTFRANRDVDGDGNSSNDMVEYSLVNEKIQKRVYGGIYPSTLFITADEIHITNLKFYVIGARAGDDRQPKAVITIQGYAGIGSTRSEFDIQTTVSQRSIDT